MHVIPLLVETGQQNNFDVCVVVDVDHETQRRRLMARNGLTAIEADARMSAQASREERIAGADIVLHNGSGVAELKEEIARLWDELVPADAAQ